jgi:Peptidase family M23
MLSRHRAPEVLDQQRRRRKPRLARCRNRLHSRERRRIAELEISRRYRRIDTVLVLAADGVVHYTGKAHGYGLVVVLKHVAPNGDTFDTRYGHMDRLKHFEVNQLIKKGEIIGHVGSNGISGGPHLHSRRQARIGRREVVVTCCQKNLTRRARTRREGFSRDGT